MVHSQPIRKLTKARDGSVFFEPGDFCSQVVTGSHKPQILMHCFGDTFMTIPASFDMHKLSVIEK